jgi:hypothetical protein
VDKLEDLARDDPSVRQQLRELLDSEDPLTVALRARVRGALTYYNQCRGESAGVAKRRRELISNVCMHRGVYTASKCGRS